MKKGRDVPRITERYSKEAFAFKENTVTVTIPFSWINKVGSKVGSKNKLTKNRQLIIKEMRHNSNVTIKELSKLIGISLTAIDNNIRFLKDNEYIKRHGADKDGYWEVLK